MKILAIRKTFKMEIMNQVFGLLSTFESNYKSIFMERQNEVLTDFC
jgi:hypothetical protein